MYCGLCIRNTTQQIPLCVILTLSSLDFFPPFLFVCLFVHIWCFLCLFFLEEILSLSTLFVYVCFVDVQTFQHASYSLTNIYLQHRLMKSWAALFFVSQEKHSYSNFGFSHVHIRVSPLLPRLWKRKLKKRANPICVIIVHLPCFNVSWTIDIWQ